MTYEEYVAQQRALDPGYGYAAPEGMYWNQLGTATPLSSADQWAAGQARNAELASSFQNWQGSSAPWFVNSNTAQRDYTNYQESRGLPVDPYILRHAHDTAFLQRHPTQADYSEFVTQLNYGANNPTARYSSAAEYEQSMRDNTASRNRTLNNTYPYNQPGQALPTDPGSIQLTASEQSALANFDQTQANLPPPPANYDPSRNYGSTGGGMPVVDESGQVIYDPTTGMGFSPAQQQMQSASQGILANSLGAGNFQVPQTPQQGLLGPVGAPPQGLASNPVRDLNYQELKTPAGLWGGLLDTVQNAGPYTSGNMGFRSPYWNPEPYMTGWKPDAFGTGYAQLNEMIGNAPAPTQVPFVSPEVQQPVVNNYYGYDPYTGTYTEGGGGLESGYTGAEVSEGSQGYSGNDPEGAANESFGAGDAHAW